MLHKMRTGMFAKLSDFINEWLVGKHDLVGIEIGSYAGESAEMFLNSGAFSKLYCIDPWIMNYDPNDSTGDEGIYDAEKAFDDRFKNDSRVIKIKDLSSNTVSQFEDFSVDFIYIDGDHRYDYIKKDIRNYFPKLKLGGIFSGHDYDGPTTPGVKRALDEFFNKIPPLKVYSDYSWVYRK